MNQYKFPPTSRYADIPIHSLFGDDGERVPYLGRRFVPAPERLALLRRHAVTEGERMDHIAALELGDPEAFWRICDANGAMRPEELTAVVGRILKIALPDGVPGTSAAGSHG